MPNSQPRQKPNPHPPNSGSQRPNQNYNYNNPQPSGYQAPNYPPPQNQNPYYQDNTYGNDYYQEFDTPGQPQSQPQSQSEKPNQFTQTWQKVTRWLTKKWWLVVLIAGALAVMVVTVTAVLTLGDNSSKNQTQNPQTTYDQVSAVIQGPSEIPQGSAGDWSVVITNQEPVYLENIRVELDFSEKFSFLEAYNPSPENTAGTVYTLPRLQPKGQNSDSTKIRFSGFLNGSINLETEMTGTLSYTPRLPDSNQYLSEQTVQLQRSVTTITSPKIDVTLNSALSQVENGGTAKLTATIENKGDKPIKNLRLRMEYPANRNTFNYTRSKYYRTTTSQPITSPDNGNNVWNLTTLPARSEQKITVWGKVFGNEATTLTFRSKLSIQDQNQRYQNIQTDSTDIKVTAQPLVVNTKILDKDKQKIFKPEEKITVQVSYKNDSQQTLRNVKLISSLDDPAGVLDLTTLSFSGGVRGDLSGSDLVWQAPRVPQLSNLKPSQSGKFRYTIEIKPRSEYLDTNLQQQQYTLTPRVKATAENISDITYLPEESYKAQGALEFSSSKLVPQGVDPSTNKRIYQVTWRLKTWQNQASNVKVKAVSPITGVWDTESIQPVSAKSSLNYNDSTGEIVWDVGRLDSYTGITQPVQEVSFNLRVDQSVDQGILRNVRASGTDPFTNQNYKTTIEEVEIGDNNS
jgi:hypothetical protein